MVDRLDTTTKSEFGMEYAFLFQYIYPRIYELRKNDVVVPIPKTTDKITASIDIL